MEFYVVGALISLCVLVLSRIGIAILDEKIKQLDRDVTFRKVLDENNNSM